ncbi:MAG: hypothetical protein P1V18_00150 [Candidatus Gracilibacteria bacterium]|nr:hypothetical protein [Candidatus Gracilibacteria bacterium]
MFKKIGASLSIIALMSTSLIVPQAQAASLSEVIQASILQDYSYESTLSVIADNRQELADMPFDLDIFADMSGVKNGFDLLNKTKVNMTMTDFNTEDLSPSMQNLSKVWVGADLEARYFDEKQTHYMMMNNIQANSNNSEINAILEMVQESMKVFTNNYYRYSLAELMESVGELADSNMATADLEEITSLFNQGSFDLKTLLPVIAEHYSELIDSGLFDIEMREANSVSQRNFSSDKIFKITLADSVTSLQAGKIQKAVGNLLVTLLPTFKDEIMWEVESMSTAQSAMAINEFLQAAKNVEAFVEITVESERVTGAHLEINLGALQMPIKIVADERISYGVQSPIVRPALDETINVNTIIDGFVSIGKLTQEQFMGTFEEVTPVDEWENTWEEPALEETSWESSMQWEPITQWENADPGMEDFMMLNAQASTNIILDQELKKITGNCEHLRCAKVQVRKFKVKMRDVYSSAQLDAMEMKLLDKLNNHFFYWSGK